MDIGVGVGARGRHDVLVDIGQEGCVRERRALRAVVLYMRVPRDVIIGLVSI